MTTVHRKAIGNSYAQCVLYESLLHFLFCNFSFVFCLLHFRLTSNVIAVPATLANTVKALTHAQRNRVPPMPPASMMLLTKMGLNTNVFALLVSSIQFEV